MKQSIARDGPKRCKPKDDLVARLNPKLDRKTMTLQVKGFWLEDGAPADDPAFADALEKGLARFATLVEAKKVDIDSVVSVT